jgi:O-antigen/teichoic acid export membrane protein
MTQPDMGMRVRRVFASGLVYGVGDFLVLGVSGFLLLPLYTHALSQADFGRYVAVKANLELLSTVMQLGLVSAAARVYFDHRAVGSGRQYMGSVLALFGLWMLILVALAAWVGSSAWQWLSPQVPSWPFLAVCIGLSVLSFLSLLGTTWLRLDEQVSAFATVQVLAAGVVAIAAWAGLTWLKMGLPAIFLAIGLSSVIGAVVLVAKLGGGLLKGLQPGPAVETLNYALPVFAGLLAYFVLNRFSTLLLQRHVRVEEVAVFGLAQQLTLLVSLTATAFGKAMQPAIWGTAAEQAPAMMRRMTDLLIGCLLAVTTLILLFATDILDLVAPESYQAAHSVLLVLALATFAYALTLASDTALLYYRKPRLSATVTICSASLSAGLGLWLIPVYGSLGAAGAMLCSFTLQMVLSYLLARQIGAPRYLWQLLLAFAVATGVALFSFWLPGASLAPVAAQLLKIIVGFAVLLVTALALFRADYFRSWVHR